MTDILYQVQRPNMKIMRKTDHSLFNLLVAVALKHHFHIERSDSMHMTSVVALGPKLSVRMQTTV